MNFFELLVGCASHSLGTIILNTTNSTVYFQITHLRGPRLVTLFELIVSTANRSTSNHKEGCLQKIVDVAADSLQLQSPSHKEGEFVEFLIVAVDCLHLQSTFVIRKCLTLIFIHCVVYLFGRLLHGLLLEAAELGAGTKKKSKLHRCGRLILEHDGKDYIHLGPLTGCPVSIQVMPKFGH
jgi:hypothetical protein